MAEGRRTPAGWLLPLLAVVLAGGFAYLNSAERVSLHLGLFVLFRVPLAVLLFVVFLLGMGTMFLIGLRQDLKVRRLLREYRIQSERRPWETEAPSPYAAAPPRYDPPRVGDAAPAPPREEEETLPYAVEEPDLHDPEGALPDGADPDPLAPLPGEEEESETRRPDHPGA